MGRDGLPSGLAYWTQAQQSMSSYQIALHFIEADETVIKWVTRLFLAWIKRYPSSSELDRYRQMAQDHGREAVIATLISSEAYREAVSRRFYAWQLDRSLCFARTQ